MLIVFHLLHCEENDETEQYHLPLYPAHLPSRPSPEKVKLDTMMLMCLVVCGVGDIGGPLASWNGNPPESREDRLNFVERGKGVGIASSTHLDDDGYFCGSAIINIRAPGESLGYDAT